MLLSLIRAISSKQTLLSFLSNDVIKVILDCLDIKCVSPSVINTCLDVISNLIFLDDDDGEEVVTEGNNIGMKLLAKYVPLLISQFTKRFEQFSNATSTAMKTSWKENSNVKHEQKRQLQILCFISESFLQNDDNKNEEWITTLESLCQLLLPFLKFPAIRKNSARGNNSYEDSFFLPILKLLQNFLPKLENSAPFFIHVSKLLGPNKANAGYSPLRLEIVEVLSTISIKSNTSTITTDEFTIKKYHKAVIPHLQTLNSKNEIQVDQCSYDLDQVIPCLTSLGKHQTWLEMTVDTTTCKQLIPLLYHLLHCLYSDDSVIHRGSFQALKTFVDVAYNQVDSLNKDDNIKNNQWINVLSTMLVPCIKQGICTKDNIMARRDSILLLRDIIHKLHLFKNEDLNLHLDLSVLVNDVDQDLDFFLNVTHVQVHRRTKAFSRLRKLLTSQSCPYISQTSLYNILLPLVKHPIYESNDTAYVQESILTLGCLCHKFAWKKYDVTLSNALANVTRFPDRESHMINLVCSIINAYHFDAIEPQDEKMEDAQKGEESSQKEVESDDAMEDDEDKNEMQININAKSSNQEQNKISGDIIWKAINNRLLPAISQLLTKETSDKSGNKQTTIRSPVTLALFKLYQKILPSSQFQLKFQNLLLQICTCLQNKDESIRSTASKTLANIASEMNDLQYLSLIIQQLALTLKEGYRLHVRISALHAVLFSISKNYKPPPFTEDATTPLDQCIPAIMDLVQQDLFGMASETKERSKVKESFGAKTFDIIEILSKMIIFDPSSPSSSIHCMTSPLLERLRVENNSKSMHKIRECFHRVVIGLSKNNTCDVNEVMKFVYATVAPFIKNALDTNPSLVDMEYEDEDNEHHSIEVSGGSKNRKNETSSMKNTTMEWLPRKEFQTSKEARYEKKAQTRKISKVVDGDNVPKQIGCKGRTKKSIKQKLLDKTPATVHAVSFGLSLLHANLKKQNNDYWINMDKQTRDLADSYIPLLTDCVAHCTENQVILLSYRCLNLFFQRSSVISDILPSASTSIPTLAKYSLELLINSGGTVSRHEMAQSCFKTLTLLMTISADSKLFEDEQMEVIVSILHAAVLDTTLDQQQLCHAIFGFIKVITSQKYKSAQFYGK